MTDVTVQVVSGAISVAVGGPGTADLAGSVMEMQAAPPHSPGTAGALLINDTGASDVAAPTWKARADIGEQPVFSVDILTAANIQLQKTSTAGTFTATPTGGKLRFQPTATGSTQGFRVAGTTSQVGLGDIVRMRLELVAAPVGIQHGVALAILQSPPNPGASMTSLDASTPVISARGDNATLSLQNPVLSTYPGSSASSPGSGTAWAEGQEIELIYTVLSETSASVTILIDGGSDFTRTFTDFPAIGYIAPGVYLISTSDQADVDPPTIFHPSLGVPQYLHLLGDATSGTGTASAPFGTLAEAVQDYRYDSSRRSLDLTLKGGVIEQSVFEGTLPFDLPGLRELTIRSTVGTRARIDASKAITPTFTNISGEYWKFPTPPFDGNATFGALIDVTDGVTQAFGNPADGGIYQHVVEGYGFLGRLTINVATTDPSFVRGRMSVHLAGDHAGNTVVRLWDGSDPNDRDWRWSSYGACVSLPASEQDGWHGRRLNMENIDMFGGFSYGLYADRWMVDLTSVRGIATVNGSPFELNHCGGKCYGLFAEGFAQDAFHSGDVGTKPLAGADAELWWYDCVGMGGANFDTVVADIWSNHGLAPYYIRGGHGKAAGKDIISTAGSLDARGVILEGAVSNGFSLAQTSANIAANGANRTASLRDAIVRGNVTGIVLNMASGTDASSILTLDDILLDSNTTHSLQIINFGTDCVAEIQYDRLRFAGPTPSFGSDFRNSGGTYTELTTRAAVP